MTIELADPHPPLCYAGREYREPKEYTWGTHRAMPPEETLERIRPHLRKGWITRVADITNLDTTGVPVAVAIRPASATLTVESGKGATPLAAFTSAAMEAIERFVAEVDDTADVTATVAEASAHLPVRADEFPMMRYGRMSASAPYDWSWMWDLRSGERVLAPRDLVQLPGYQSRTSLHFPWGASSNGLASGNHLPEAVCAALYEVIERDAITCWQVAQQAGVQPLLVDPATFDGPVLHDILGRLDRAGIDAVIYWCPTEVGVPTAMAVIVDRKRGVGLYRGYGCHLDPEVAMVRAVTEAVQARTIFVAGARDDLMRSGYEVLKRSDLRAADEFFPDVPRMSVADVPNQATRTFHGDVAVLLDRLDQAGFRHVLARELDAARFEVSVVRVIVPGLETYRFPWLAVGERARRFDPAAVINGAASWAVGARPSAGHGRHERNADAYRAEDA